MYVYGEPKSPKRPPRRTAKIKIPRFHIARQLPASQQPPLASSHSGFGFYTLDDLCRLCHVSAHVRACSRLMHHDSFPFKLGAITCQESLIAVYAPQRTAYLLSALQPCRDMQLFCSSRSPLFPIFWELIISNFSCDNSWMLKIKIVELHVFLACRSRKYGKCFLIEEPLRIEGPHEKSKIFILNFNEKALWTFWLENSTLHHLHPCD